MRLGVNKLEGRWYNAGRVKRGQVMKKNLVGLVVVMLVSACASMFNTGPNVSGTWNVAIDTQGGVLERSLELIQDGDQLTGTYNTQAGPVPIKGTFSDNSISFKLTIEIQGQSVELSYAATVEGDKISGTVNAGDFGSIPFTGTRQQ
jgi:hypothetical protein|tara:strand:+ start:1238 stop:1678 length:441 start_codon:yes stop_codon:yes gene_type:complete